MRLTADNQGRLACPELFPPGTTFDAEQDAAGQIVLKEKVVQTGDSSQVRLVRRNGRTMLVSDRKLSNEDTQRVMETFP
jgi:hypothetical protein